ncbi:hypothetical protein H6F51_10480 [Cyanobacteria bacterium FACHB-DQ100]|nr:hypothetical protein [Cyanobacteria bacterium FACHB-DQ100]
MEAQIIQSCPDDFMLTPEFEPTRKQLAILADCSVRTIDYDVALLKHLVPKEFKYIAGQEIFTHEQKRAILGVRKLFKKFNNAAQVRDHILRNGVPLV